MDLIRHLTDLKQFALRVSLLTLFFVSSGCTTTPIQEPIAEPAMQAIQQAYRKTVTEALNDPNENWTSGWAGNMWINFWGANNLGLCYHWKYRVHAGVKETVHAQQWALSGIVINRGTSNEHHAVVVYDPARINADAILSASNLQPVYVLDPWRQGQADIYHIQDWLKLPTTVYTAASLIPINKTQK